MKRGYCGHCGWRFSTTQTDPARIHGPCPKCGVEKWEISPAGFGDRIAWLLRRVGLTKARWWRFKVWLLRSKLEGCGCEERQAILNRWFPW